MKLKKTLITLLSLLMVFVLAACSGGADQQTSQNSSAEPKKAEEGKKDNYVVGIATSNVNNKFWTYIVDAMKEKEKEYPEFEFIYNDAQNDVNKQMTQIETYIAQRVDAIVMSPVDTLAAVTMLEKANAAGIPFIVVNESFDGVEKATSYVGSKSIESGLIQMEEVAKLLNGKGNIAIMNGQLGHEAQIKRTEGNKEIVSKFPEMKVVAEKEADWDRAKGMALMENWIQSGQPIDAVVANNDEMALGAAMALEAAGKADKVLVAGIDATPDALEYVKSGKLKVTVFQDAAGQGTKAIETAVKAAKGESVEKEVIVPYQLVTQENVEVYVKKWQK